MKQSYKISIIGAGNAGCAHAFKLSEAGHSVSIIKTSHAMHDDNFNSMCVNEGIWAIDHTNGDKKSFQHLPIITRDIELGLKNAEIVLVMTQTLQHESISDLIAPYITSNVKMILIIPGNLGSVIFKNKLQNKNVLIGEGESTPFDARISELGLVNILFKNVRNKLAFFPSSNNKAGMSLSKDLLDTYDQPRTNVIESSLHNPNLIVHTIGVIMSAARIEYTKGEFWMYREAFTKSIWNLVDALDSEKNLVIDAYGGKPSSYIDECKYRNENDLTKDSFEVFRSYANDGGPKGPSSIHSRYLYEDVPNGLCLLSNLGKKAGISTPLCDSLITIASGLVRENFHISGRRFKDLGWDDFSKEQIIELITC